MILLYFDVTWQNSSMHELVKSNVRNFELKLACTTDHGCSNPIESIAVLNLPVLLA